MGWLQDARDLDAAIYAAIARAKTPTIDEAMRRLSRAADYSRLWLALAGGLATVGGPSGRRAAARGLESVAVAATLANVVAKPLSARRRPDRNSHRIPALRQVRMPRSSSFPSGHSASAFAFATAVAHVLPPLTGPLRALAALVAYSRVHTGVHYLGDVVAGAILGVCSAEVTARLIEAQRPHYHHPNLMKRRAVVRFVGRMARPAAWLSPSRTPPRRCRPAASDR